jgi:hypothetical protein
MDAFLTMDDRPGGFTFIMFWPHYIAGGHNSKLVKKSIRETFGDAKVIDNMVKYYAWMNFCLPASLQNFMIQLEMCYRTLELFTNQKGIASAGYRLASKIIAEHKKRYRPLFDSDLSLRVKIGQFLDNFFQNFCSESAVHDDEKIMIKYMPVRPNSYITAMITGPNDHFTPPPWLTEAIYEVASKSVPTPRKPLSTSECHRKQPRTTQPCSRRASLTLDGSSRTTIQQRSTV